MLSAQSSEREAIPIICGLTCMRLPVEEVQFIEQRTRKIHFVDRQGREFRINGKIDDILYYLADRSFYRPMKSLVINMDMIEIVKRDHIVFRSGIIYAIGRNNLIKVRRDFRLHLKGEADFRDSPYYIRSELPPGGEKDRIEVDPIDSLKPANQSAAFFSAAEENWLNGYGSGKETDAGNGSTDLSGKACV